MSNKGYFKISIILIVFLVSLLSLYLFFQPKQETTVQENIEIKNDESTKIDENSLKQEIKEVVNAKILLSPEERKNKCEINVNKLELIQNGKKTFLANLLIFDELYIYKNNLYFTETNIENKTFSVFKISAEDLKPTKMYEYKVAGISDVDAFFSEGNLYFILNRVTLYRLNLTEFKDVSQNLKSPMIFSKFSNKEILLVETDAPKCPVEVFTMVPKYGEIYDVKTLYRLEIINDISSYNPRVENLKYLGDNPERIRDVIRTNIDEILIENSKFKLKNK